MTDLEKIKKASKILGYSLVLSKGKSTKWSSRLANFIVRIQFKKAKSLGLYDRNYTDKQWNSIFYNENI